MAPHTFNFRLITRDDSTAASRGRTPKPVTGIEIGGPDDERRCRKPFLNLQDIPETQLQGWNLEVAICPRRGISGDGRPR